MNWRLIVKKNYQQILIVFFIFLFMIAGNFVFSSFVLRRQLINGGSQLMNAAETNLNVNLLEPESVVTSSAFNIRNMIVDKNNSQEDILEYLIGITDWFLANDDMLSGFNGIYGVIRGDYMDGSQWEPPEDFVPEKRPWYIAAQSARGVLARTTPFDVMTKEFVATYSQEIFDDRGASLGIVSMDVLLTRLDSYICSLKLSEGGYGILLNEDLVVIIHPDNDSIGKSAGEIFFDTGGLHIKENPFGEKDLPLMDRLRANKEINALQVKDVEGKKAIVFFRPTANGWYLGLVTPEADFYRDMYRIGFVISLVGIILMLVLCFMLLRLSAAKIRSDEESQSKSSFLARMSHEIRTPMNAVIGMSELAIRAETLPKMAEYVTGIKHAGLNLLSLINDILDFSKIEAGSLQITPAPYLLASLINDVINVVRIRISEKPILFTVNIDANTPNNLLGDESRIRQVLLNLLSNAAKYTHEGYIMVTISAEILGFSFDDGQNLILKIEIADSGIGIKKEDLPGLFGNFVRLDAEKNKNVEGTGLGLAITRNLCLAMGGDITVQSKYGEGSVFTAIIPQTFTDDKKLAKVENPAEKNILFYDERVLYAESLFLTLENLGVPVTVTIEPEDFLKKLIADKHPFAFVSISIAEQAAALIKEKSLKTVLVLLANLGEITSFKEIPSIVMPAWSVPIANVLNGNAVMEYLQNTEVRFTAPAARLLIVDDIETNLRVAEGLLTLYQTTIDTCTGGEQAIALVKEHRYDIVFMDHMMPGMDGIEAAAAIRAWEDAQGADSASPESSLRIPIIALTANAISGMKEIFLSKGFSDYLAKPIEMPKLDEIMAKWIPKEKKVRNKQAAKTSSESGEHPAAGDTEKLFTAQYPLLVDIGVDVKKGMVMTGGSDAGYRKVLRSFYKDTLSRLPVFAAMPGKEKLPDFTINAHALKSAAASIGAAEVSRQALELETAGKAEDLEAIAKGLKAFHGDLKNLAEQIGLTLNADAGEGGAALSSGPGGKGSSDEAGKALAESLPRFRELASALEQEDIAAIRRTLGELETKAFDAQTRETLSAISNAVMMCEFEEALNTIKELIS
ncbi:hypothetical protein AGMMS49546_18160 [Spirochaetia bacterium]|nr:hypothetical protein AGMMS49546_18160 [Spirochaetia bacterium]